jgi:hypothetical protein
MGDARSDARSVVRSVVAGEEKGAGRSSVSITTETLDEFRYDKSLPRLTLEMRSVRLGHPIL